MCHRHLDLELVDRLELFAAVEAVDNDVDVDILLRRTEANTNLNITGYR